MMPNLKFETREESVDGEIVLKYYINGKCVDANTYNTLKLDYNDSNNKLLLPSSKSKQKDSPKLDIDDLDDLGDLDNINLDDEDYPDDTEENCMCPVCQSRFDILDLITIFGEEKLDFEYLYESLGDILDELYDIAFNDGQVNGLQNIANISVDMAEAIMTGKLEDGLIDVDDVDGMNDIDNIN